MKYRSVAMPQQFRVKLEQAQLLRAIEIKSVMEQVDKMVIRDLRFHPSNVEFSSEGGTSRAPLVLHYHRSDGTKIETVTVHPHALRQLCAKVSFPISYAKTLATHDPGRSLFEFNMNRLFDFEPWVLKNGQKIRFLHRIVNGQLRGFISRRFNRHLVSGPMLHAFLVSCEDVGAKVVAASSNDVRFRVKAVLPEVYEPMPGIYCRVGVEWGNSDFGAGALEVTTFLNMVNTGHFVTFGGFRKVHIGSVTESTEDMYEEPTFSDVTYQAEVETQSLAIRDAVVTQLNDDRVESLLDAVADAYDTKLSWSEISAKIKVIAGTKAVDKLKEALDDGFEELPSVSRDANGVPQPTRFWAMSACSWLAANEIDADKRASLEAIGGSMLTNKMAA